MKRGHAAVLLIVLLVGVLGLGLLVAERMSQPTGLQFTYIPTIPTQPIPTQPITVPTPAKIKQMISLPAEPGTGTCSTDGTLVKCECNKRREIVGECSKPVSLGLFYADTVFGKNDVLAGSGGYGYQKTLEWSCHWQKFDDFEHFVPGKNLCNKPAEQQKVCDALKIKCKIKYQKKFEIDKKLNLCVTKAKELCKGSFYQGKLEEVTKASSKG